MRILKFDDMKRGWFVGDFEPTVFASKEFEVAIKEYHAGQTEEWHYHKIATEITVIFNGVAEMSGRRIGPREIVLLESGEGSDFRAVTDVVTVVVKIPSIMGDKYGRQDTDA